MTKRTRIFVPAVGATSMKGEYRAILRDLMGNVVRDTGWMKNVITDVGLVNLLTSDAWATYCRIGSSSQAPATTDTGCVADLGRSDSSRGESNNVVNGAPDYECLTTKGWRFNAGTATGTIREMTITPSSTNNTSATSRVLISPAIVKGVDQVLDVYWRGTVYRQKVDIVANNVDITEDGGSVLYNVTSRGANYGVIDPSTIFRQFCSFQASSWVTGYDGYIAAITSAPTGNAAGTYGTGYVSIAAGAINTSGNTAWRDFTVSWSLDHGSNFGSQGLRGVRWRYPMNYDIQFGFDQVLNPGQGVPLNETNILDITFRFTFTRL